MVAFPRKVNGLWKCREKKKKSSYNSGPDISELYNVLGQGRFTTSKLKLDIQYNKAGVQVASGVTKQQKTLK